MPDFESHDEEAKGRERLSPEAFCRSKENQSIVVSLGE
jgi:hypothetical protein